MNTKKNNMTYTEDMVLFWGGPFSQWAKCSFVYDGHVYNCAEQAMMAEKARMFNDMDALDSILKTSDPKIQKAIGRSVKNFNVELWELKCREIVTAINYCKFRHNKEFRDILLETGDKELVEASPYDKIWGIGLSETDPNATDKSKWRGRNWLGECLMKARTQIREHMDMMNELYYK